MLLSPELGFVLFDLGIGLFDRALRLHQRAAGHLNLCLRRLDLLCQRQVAVTCFIVLRSGLRQRDVEGARVDLKQQITRLDELVVFHREFHDGS